MPLWCSPHHPIFLLPSPQQSIVLNKTSRITPHLPPNLEISLFLCLPQVLCRKVYELAVKKILTTPLDLIWVCFCCCALHQALSASLPLPLQFFLLCTWLQLWLTEESAAWHCSCRAWWSIIRAMMLMANSPPPCPFTSHIHRVLRVLFSSCFCKELLKHLSVPADLGRQWWEEP